MYVYDAITVAYRFMQQQLYVGMYRLDILTAISPIDGRYRSKAGALASYFSEYALIKYRVQVEIEYFIIRPTPACSVSS